jgi:DNA-binding NarL/FixJ family response regulator
LLTVANAMEEAGTEAIRCVLLAERHQGLSEGIRGLLAAVFDVVVMVGDEVSLIESASRMHGVMAVVDFSLTHGDGLGLIRRLRRRFNTLPLIVISVHDEANVSRSVLEAGANGFVLKSQIASDLLAAVDAVLLGQSFVSSDGTRAPDRS